jgi:hypothetical protein
MSSGAVGYGCDTDGETANWQDSRRSTVESRGQLAEATDCLPWPHRTRPLDPAHRSRHFDVKSASFARHGTLELPSAGRVWPNSDRRQYR